MERIKSKVDRFILEHAEYVKKAKELDGPIRQARKMRDAFNSESSIVYLQLLEEKRTLLRGVVCVLEDLAKTDGYFEKAKSKLASF